MKAIAQSGTVSRRNLLMFSAGVIGAGAFSAMVGSKSIAQESPEPVLSNDMTPDQALELLMQGNQRFVQRQTENINQSYERLAQVAKTQKPFASILGCADSRTPAEIIFDRGFGDLFVCRVAGNIAVPEEIGSLEFGAAILGTKVIMVMGHERCGAVDACLKGSEAPGQIGSLIEAIEPAVEQVRNQPGDPLENAVRANVLLQIENLKTSPILSQLIDEGKLKIVGAYYDLDTGMVSPVS